MDIRSTLTELCAAFNAHDLDRIMAFFSEDCVLDMPRGDKPWRGQGPLWPFLHWRCGACQWA